MDFSTRFLAALDYTLVNEGVTYTNRPDDRGGPTKMGITLQTLTAWWARNNKTRKPTAMDVASLTIAEVQEIYNALYWQPLQADSYPTPGLAKAAFDSAVLMGVPRAVVALQNTLFGPAATTIKVDGLFGPKTLTAIQSYPAAGQYVLIRNMAICVLTHCVDIAVRDSTQAANLRIWALRAGRMGTLCLDTTPEKA